MRLPKDHEENQNREEGLKKIIDSTNKGFEMLKKMGYKEGINSIRIVYGVGQIILLKICLHIFRIFIRGKLRKIKNWNC